MLSQGLADHAHPPTPATLPRALPIVAPPSAAALLSSLSFRNATIDSPGDDAVCHVAARLDVRVVAKRGLLVGPP